MNSVPRWVIRLGVLLVFLSLIFFLPQNTVSFIFIAVGGWQLGTWTAYWGDYLYYKMRGDNEDNKQEE